MPVIITVAAFDPFKIMDSGQCFRMVAPAPDTVETVAFGRRVTVTALGNGRFAFGCTQEEYHTVWRPYFALDTDYEAIWNAAPKPDAYLARALRHTRGLRVLRQDPWETLCSFLLSTRKHIRAIRACVETLCDRYGESVPGTARRAFPTPQSLASLQEGELRLCQLGYRAPYLLDAARKVADGAINLSALAAMPDDRLFAALQTIHGTGPKVADCVMLFGYGRLSRAPVDVWIRRVIDEAYGGANPFPGYGAYAGVYQQAMFMYKRDLGNH